MQLRLQLQESPVADEVAAVTAVVRPILEGTLYGLKVEVVAQVGGYGRCTLSMLSRLYRPGDGDCGLCFEYAVHDALNRQEPAVMERIHDAAHRHCNVPGAEPSSTYRVERDAALDKLLEAIENPVAAPRPDGLLRVRNAELA
jgi:hypothetical protein